MIKHISAALKGEVAAVADDGAIDGGREQATRNKKRLTVMGVEFVYVYLIGIATAFLGWLGENFVRLATQGVLDSRFHILPFISVYALVPLAFQILLGDPDDLRVFGRKLFKRECGRTKLISNLVCLGLIFAAVFLGELVVGNAWEKFFGVQLWDYNSMPLHVTQYAGLIPTLGYGGAAYLLFKFVYKPVLRTLRAKVSFKCAKLICSTVGVLIVLDTVIMALNIIILKTPPVYWTVKVW